MSATHPTQLRLLEMLDKELSEMRDSEMWRAGAAVRALRPENRKKRE